jgi:hypothetical protein
MRTVLLGLLMSFALIAQSAEGDYSLSGTVLNSVTGELVKGALVILTGYPQIDAARGRQGRPITKTATTGVGGEYLFGGLSAGTYTMAAQKPGFVPHSAPARAPRNYPSASPDNLVVCASVFGHAIQLDPLGVIEGRVTNQHGDSLSGVYVGLFECSVEDGVRRVRPGRSAMTNDRGVFRLWDLQPGKYYVKAMGRAGGTAMYVGVKPVNYDLSEGFRPVFFGGGRDMESATPVVVGAGTQAHADFTVSVEPTYKVRGILGNFVRGQYVAFELLEGDLSVAAPRAFVDSETGRFEIDDVPSGQYTLRVTQAGSRGEAALSVKSADAGGVSVALVPAVTVTGTVHVVGEAPEVRKNPFTGATWSPLQSCNVTLAEAHEPSAHFFAPVQDDGVFSIEKVFAGRYVVRTGCSRGYVVSAVSGRSDLLSGPAITVQPGVPPPSIEIGVAFGGGGITVNLTAPAAPAGLGVLLVPAFAAASGPVSAVATLTPGSTDKLVVRFQNLAPGDYQAYAIPDIQSVEYRNPAFLSALTGGTSIRVEDGKTTEVTLTSVAR